ncbi:hypothetical protein BDZ89DRAFT_1046704 [Hymenopellis radicata]|nr:hypothetical protein BDZ89DRAFT_1046704 [Hymenopellis radicata]
MTLESILECDFELTLPSLVYGRKSMLNCNKSYPPPNCVRKPMPSQISTTPPSPTTEALLISASEFEVEILEDERISRLSDWQGKMDIQREAAAAPVHILPIQLKIGVQRDGIPEFQGVGIICEWYSVRVHIHGGGGLDPGCEKTTLRFFGAMKLEGWILLSLRLTYLGLTAKCLSFFKLAAVLGIACIAFVVTSIYVSARPRRNCTKPRSTYRLLAGDSELFSQCLQPSRSGVETAGGACSTSSHSAFPSKRSNMPRFRVPVAARMESID